MLYSSADIDLQRLNDDALGLVCGAIGYWLNCSPDAASRLESVVIEWRFARRFGDPALYVDSIELEDVRYR